MWADSDKVHKQEDCICTCIQQQATTVPSQQGMVTWEVGTLAILLQWDGGSLLPYTVQL